MADYLDRSAARYDQQNQRVAESKETFNSGFVEAMQMNTTPHTGNNLMDTFQFEECIDGDINLGVSSELKQKLLHIHGSLF